KSATASSICVTATSSARSRTRSGRGTHNVAALINDETRSKRCGAKRQLLGGRIAARPTSEPSGVQQEHLRSSMMKRVQRGVERSDRILGGAGRNRTDA